MATNHILIKAYIIGMKMLPILPLCSNYGKMYRLLQWQFIVHWASINLVNGKLCQIVVMYEEPGIPPGTPSTNMV